MTIEKPRPSPYLLSSLCKGQSSLFPDPRRNFQLLLIQQGKIGWLDIHSHQICMCVVLKWITSVILSLSELYYTSLPLFISQEMLLYIGFIYEYHTCKGTFIDSVDWRTLVTVIQTIFYLKMISPKTNGIFLYHTEFWISHLSSSYVRR